MREKISQIFPSSIKGKKYTAIVADRDTGATRRIHFGAVGYQQYADSTGVGKYSSHDHRTAARRRGYFSRHSAGITKKGAAIRHEVAKSGGRYNAKILSHQYLW